jgi:hypothetical protein
MGTRRSSRPFLVPPDSSGPKTGLAGPEPGTILPTSSWPGTAIDLVLGDSAQRHASVIEAIPLCTSATPLRDRWVDGLARAVRMVATSSSHPSHPYVLDLETCTRRSAPSPASICGTTSEGFGHRELREPLPPVVRRWVGQANRSDPQRAPLAFKPNESITGSGNDGRHRRVIRLSS